LTFTDRIRIESLLKEGKNAQAIAKRINVHISTIYREVTRGQYEHLNSDLTTETRYSHDIAQRNYEANLAAKGADLKIGKDLEFANYIEKRIVEDDISPAAVLGEISQTGKKFNTTICTSTLYSYIDKGVFLTLTNKHLPAKGKRKRKYRRVRKHSRPPRGDSIEKRPNEVNTRETFGHWEMDCLEGKKASKKVLLVLTERQTRYEYLFPMKDQTAESVVKALDRMERKFGSVFPLMFKSITVDNGSEFSDVNGMERSITGKGKRTSMYYCHPFSSYERPSNENQNKMLRRKFPKGCDFSIVTNKKIRHAENWLNNYPRAIFKFRTSYQLFLEKMKTLEHSG
jgi:IS30 family transposase